jgi:tetratricopeptide (TPR) repeat protein
LFLGILVMGAYANSFSAAWQFDDKTNITGNLWIRNTSLNLTSLVQAMVQDHKQNRFFSNLTFALNYYFNRDRVGGYHLVNLLWHLAASGLVFCLLRVTFRRAGLPAKRRDLAALLAAAVWAVHPLQTQAVTYIVQRQTVMASALMLGTLLAYIAGREARSRSLKRAFYLAAGLSLLLALCSKEIAFVTPVLLLFYELYFFQNFSSAFLRRQRPAVVSALIFLSLLLTISLRPAVRSLIFSGYQQYPFTPGQRLLTELRVLWQYLGLILWPLPSRLSVEHDPLLSTSLFHPWTTLPAIAAWLCLLAAAIRYARRYPLLSFALLWYLANLFLESSFIPLDLMFEHRLYLPSLALITPLIAAPVFFLHQRRAAGVCLGAIIVMFILGTLSRNHVWQTESSLWKDCIRKAPLKPRSYLGLGTVYWQEGEKDRAIATYHQALKLDPANAEAYFNLGCCYLQDDSYGPALADFSKAIALRPDYLQALNNRGNLYRLMGETDRALLDYGWALASNPYFLQAYLGRANTYLARGQEDLALADYSKVLELDSTHAEAHFNRGNIYLNQGQLPRAIADYDQALASNPNYSKAYYNRGNAYSRQGQSDQAIADYSMALKLKPNYAKAYFNRGNAYLEKGERDRAEADLAKARVLDPELFNRP